MSARHGAVRGASSGPKVHLSYRFCFPMHFAWTKLPRGRQEFALCLLPLFLVPHP